MVTMSVDYSTQNQDISSREDDPTDMKRTKKDINEAHDICGHIGEAEVSS